MRMLTTSREYVAQDHISDINQALMDSVDQSTLIAARIVGSIVITMTAVVLFLMLIGRYRKLGILGFHYLVNSKIFSVQILTIGIGFLFGTVSLITFYTQIERLCKISVIVEIFLYGGATFSLYVFLMLRSQIVKFGRTAFLIYLEKFLILLLIVFAMTCPLIIVLNSESISVPVTASNESTCVFVLEPWVSMVMFCFDSVLSIGYLLLFIIPLFSGSKKFRSKAIENLLLSSIMVITTSVLMIYLTFYAIDYNSSVVGMILSLLDILMNIICTFLMTLRGWKLPGTHQADDMRATNSEI